jgi:hypothetical protein
MEARKMSGISRARFYGSVCALLVLVSVRGSGNAASALTPPSNVSTVGSSESRIDVSWRDNSSSETGFEVHRSTTGPNGGFGLLGRTAAQALSYTDAGLNPLSQYCYKIRAFKATGAKAGYSEFSAAGCAATLAPPVPLAPSGVQSHAMSESAIDVWWQDNSANESGFEVFRSGSGPEGAFTWLTRTHAGTTAWRDTNLTPSTQYCYKVRAYRDAGGVSYSAFSNTTCATTTAPPSLSQLQLTTSTTGVDLDPDGYALQLWQRGATPNTFIDVRFTILAANGTTIFELDPGTYELRFLDVAVNCDLEGSNLRVVSTGVQPEPVRFDVVCTPPSQLLIADMSDGNTEIYVVNANGTGVQRLTTHAASDLEPAWSPDGTKIAFRSDRDGADEIYIMNTDGSNPERLTYSTGGNLRPEWSPDGTKIAFTSYRDGNGEIYVMNADGSGLVNITNHPSEDDHPTWSPDGTRIAFSSTRDHPFGYPGIYVTDSAGSTVIGLPASLYTPRSEPAWSPDGAWLAITETNYAQTVVVMDLRDGSIVWGTLPSDPDCQTLTAPAWSADSRALAFVQTNWCQLDPNDGVHVIKVDEMSKGTNGMRIAPGVDPAWRRQ